MSNLSFCVAHEWTADDPDTDNDEVCESISLRYSATIAWHDRTSSCQLSSGVFLVSDLQQMQLPNESLQYHHENGKLGEHEELAG